MNKNKNKSSRRRNKSNNESLMFFLTPLLIFTISFFAVSLLSVIFDLQKHLNFPVITAILSLCTFLSAFLTSKKKREKGLITGIIHNLPSITLIELISLLLNGFSPDLNLLLSLATMLIASALGGVVGVNSKQKAKRSVR